MGKDRDFLLDLWETADYGGVAEATRASADKPIEEETNILAALKHLLPPADTAGL